MNKALLAYRRLLRAQRQRFQGDPQILQAARRQTRQEFDQNRSLEDPKKIQKTLKHADQVEQVIRHYLVQAPLSSSAPNTYQIKFSQEHALRDAHPIIIKSSLKK